MAESIRVVLRTLRALYGLTQDQLARALGVSRSLVSMWETGQATLDGVTMERLRADYPRAFASEAISERSPVGGPPQTATAAESVAHYPAAIAEAAPVAKLLGDPEFPVSYALVPLRYGGLVPASSEWGDPLSSEDFVEVDAKFVKKGRFACKVVGDSCYPALRQGDLTIWEVDPSPKYGLIVLAQRKGDHGCTVKQLIYDATDRRDRLMPVNPAYDSPPDGEGWGVIARLVGVVREGGVERSWYSAAGMRPKYLTGDPDDE